MPPRRCCIVSVIRQLLQARDGFGGEDCRMGNGGLSLHDAVRSREAERPRASKQVSICNRSLWASTDRRNRVYSLPVSGLQENPETAQLQNTTFENQRPLSCRHYKPYQSHFSTRGVVCREGTSSPRLLCKVVGREAGKATSTAINHPPHLRNPTSLTILPAHTRDPIHRSFTDFCALFSPLLRRIPADKAE